VKTCNKCGETKALTEYAKDSKLKDGHTGSCKKCQNAYQREWYKNNLEKRLASRKKHYEKYKEVINAKTRVKRTTDEFRAKRRATRDLEKNKISCRKYYANNYESKIKPRHAEYSARPEVIERAKELHRKDYLTKGIERNKRKIAEVTPKYVKELLRQSGNLKGVPIPEALIAVKRLQILIKRRVKNEISNNITK
jgi:hypothetical protein